MCFHVLEEILQLVLGPKTSSQPKEHSFNASHTLSFPSPVTLLTQTLFAGPLVQCLFSPAHNTRSNSVPETAQRRRGAAAHWETRGESEGGRREGERREGGRRKGCVEEVCIGGMGKLLSAALRSVREFGRSNCFLSVFESLLDRIVGNSRDDDIGKDGGTHTLTLAMLRVWI